MRKPRNYWTYEKCKEVALKYNTRTEFNINDKSCYLKSYKNNWLDEICSHMNILGHKYKRCVYSYEFEDNSVYIGLTYDIDNRQLRRNSDVNDQVSKYIKKTNYQPIRKQLTDYIDVINAIYFEKYYVEKYKNEGWNILNKSKTGSLGSNVIRWTKEKCQEDALKYINRKQFKENSCGAYYSSINNNWLDEVCSHMTNKIQKPKKYWTKEKCQEVLLTCKNIKEFKEKYGGGYNSVLKNNWINDIYSKNKHNK